MPAPGALPVRCSQSAAGNGNCQLGAILQGINNNTYKGSTKKEPHHLLPFVWGSGNVYALVCAHLRCDSCCTTHHSITVAHKSMQQSLANGAALIFSHRSPFDGHAGVIYGTDYSQTRTRIQLWLFGFLVGAHLKMTIINCMYYLRPLAPIGCQLALAERAASAAIPYLSVWALRAPYSQSFKWAYWLETQHFECVTCVCFGYCITKSQAFLPRGHKSFAQFGNYC